MSQKEVLVRTVKEWMELEYDIKKIQKDMKLKKENKKKLSEKLVDIMKTNEIDCLDISDGKILYTKNNIKSSLSKKHILDCLSKYFKDNEDVKPEDVTSFILENRTTKVKENIVHKNKTNTKE